MLDKYRNISLFPSEYSLSVDSKIKKHEYYLRNNAKYYPNSENIFQNLNLRKIKSYTQNRHSYIKAFKKR